MDITITKKSPSKLKKYWYVPLAAMVVAGGVWAKGVLGDVSFVVDSKTVRLANVKKNEFIVDVRSNGELRPKVYQWVSAEIDGRIETILARAGDSVEVGQPLIKLRNPQLLSQHEEAEWAFKQASSEAFASQKNRESQMLQLQSESLRAELAYRGNQLKLEAEQKLIVQGTGIVSEIDHKRTIFSVEEQLKIWQFYQKRLAKMTESNTAQKLADDARVARLNNDVVNMQRKVDLLTVRSLGNGIVQEMQLDIGQKMDIGTTVARVADDSELIAELKVQELQVQSVEVGQKVIIDTRKNKLNGKVIRIHPSVVNGMVQVDVALLQDLTPEARIALSVEGSIRTYSLPDTLFVQRPAFAQSNATIGIYKIDSEGNNAQRVQVRLGQSSTNFIQIIGGLNEGDQIIVSDTSSYAEHQSVLLN
jgi:HlyD family secretion protein